MKIINKYLYVKSHIWLNYYSNLLLAFAQRHFQVCRWIVFITKFCFAVQTLKLLHQSLGFLYSFLIYLKLFLSNHKSTKIIIFRQITLMANFSVRLCQLILILSLNLLIYNLTGLLFILNTCLLIFDLCLHLCGSNKIFILNITFTIQ